jgi:hypothetical protein
MHIDRNEWPVDVREYTRIRFGNLERVRRHKRRLPGWKDQEQLLMDLAA